MPRLFIHITNSQFRSRDEGNDYEDATSALASGILSAVTVAADEVAQGLRSACVEIGVEEANGTLLLRSVVSVAVSPLLPPRMAPDESD